VGGAAIHKVALMLKEKILKYAAEYTHKPASDLDVADGDIICVSDNNKKLVSLEELATDTLYHTEHAEHLTAEATAQVKTNAFSFGCAFAEVEVDIPLAKVTLLNMINCHDCGTLINPKTAEGQVHGGMSMAIGFGMFEHLLYDPKTGKPLNANLLDYKLPTMLDHPRLEAQFVENPEPTSPYGTKALGEPPTVPGASAIRNAVLHATGVAVNTIPMTPHVLFEEFKKAGLI
jgi:xanthine dehydrogenase molybdenum-binding subunit